VFVQFCFAAKGPGILVVHVSAVVCLPDSIENTFCKNLNCCFESESTLLSDCLSSAAFVCLFKVHWKNSVWESHLVTNQCWLTYEIRPCNSTNQKCV